MNIYDEKDFTLDKAFHLAANDELPYLRKRLRQEYAQFLIDFYELQEDPIQQQILESARMFRNQHDMNQTDSIRQAIKLRKYLFMDIWPNHNIEENNGIDKPMKGLKPRMRNEQRKKDEVPYKNKNNGVNRSIRCLTRKLGPLRSRLQCMVSRF